MLKSTLSHRLMLAQGSRERVQEDLQFGWEVLAAPSSEKCPNSNENGE